VKALLVSATLAILVATPVFAADSVSLVGTWTGQRDRIAKVEGRRGGLATLVITEQQGYTFVGRLKRSNATGDEDEPLWGAFTPGGKLIMGSDDEGYYIFALIDQDTLDYCYSEAAPSPRTVCARLIRQR
jgi:opacity protein-like surface antigen